MGLFDVLNFGDALAVKPNFQQSYQNDLNNEKMINSEISRIEDDTRSAADRMKRVQLTTGKGVNQKLQAYYDGLTQQMKSTISKNPNYKTDPYQMQQVNAVMDQYSSNDIIANDMQSKASYNQFKDQAAKGVLTSREINEAEQRWKRYQDGIDDVFDYTNTKKVDYTKDAIMVAQQIKQMNLRRGIKNKVRMSDLEKSYESTILSNPEYLDQALVNFKTQTSLSEKAKWLGVAYKEHRTQEEEQELQSDVDGRMKELVDGKAMGDPLKKWMADGFYAFTNDENDQLSLMKKQASMYAVKHAKAAKDSTPYFRNDVGNAVSSAREWVKVNEGTHAFDIKLNATNAFFSENRNGLPVSNRMNIRTKNGYVIPIPSHVVGYMDGNNTPKQNQLANGRLIVTNNKGNINQRMSVTSQGFVKENDYLNIITSMGIKMEVDNNKHVTFTHRGKRIVQYNDTEENAKKRFMIDQLHGGTVTKGANGMGYMVSPFDGVILPYNVETDQDMTNSNLERAYNEEVYMKKKKYQLEEDALNMNAGGVQGSTTTTEFSGMPGIQ